MNQGVFRKVSLDRLSSPEQLDKLMTVTTPKAWAALLAIGLLLVAAVMWGIFGSIPTKTYAQGIMLKSGGIYNISHIKSGKITDIRVEEGDIVKKGEVVARIDQQDLVKRINDYKRELDQLEHLDSDSFDIDQESMSPGLSELYKLNNNLIEAKANLEIKENNYVLIKAGTSNEDLSTARYQLEQANIEALNLQKEFNSKKVLYENGAVSESDYRSAKEQMDLATVKIKGIEDVIKKYTSEEYSSNYKAEVEQSKLRVDLLTEQIEVTKRMKITEAKNQIDTLQKELELSANIISQVDGRVVEVKVKNGDIFNAGSDLLSLVREGDMIKDLEVVMYVKAEEGKKILPGMEAQVVPTIVKKEEHGYMLGRVVSVSEYPASAQGMMRTLGNKDLVAKLSGQSTPIEIKIDLVSDESTVSGYRWSTPQGLPSEINSGTLCTGSVTVSKEKPINMVVPLIKKYLPIE